MMYVRSRSINVPTFIYALLDEKHKSYMHKLYIKTYTFKYICVITPPYPHILIQRNFKKLSLICVHIYMHIYIVYMHNAYI